MIQSARFVLVATLFLIASCGRDQACVGSDGYGFVCGPQNAEDLVLLPGTKWIVASGMAPGPALYLVDSEDKSWSEIYPGQASLAEPDTSTYETCPGAPDTETLVTHGLSLRAGQMGHSTLYAVSHGAREAIEVFDIDASGNVPLATWTGCVPMPEGLEANSIASFPDGSLVATVLLHPDKTFRDLIAGEPTGAVYEWSPGDSGFELVRGSELPGNNGIEVSADGREIYVVSSGLSTVVAFSHSNPTRRLRTTRRMDFTPDNVHMGSDGRLITAGMINNEPACGGFPSPEEFDIEEMAACPRGFVAAAIDPATMQATVLAQGQRHADFSNATMALPAGDEVWIGTFSGDRIGYVEQQ
jgi:hypothetical protein